jgi:hypothetical protein
MALIRDGSHATEAMNLRGLSASLHVSRGASVVSRRNAEQKKRLEFSSLFFAELGHAELSAAQSVVASNAIHESVRACLQLSTHIRIISQERL